MPMPDAYDTRAATFFHRYEAQKTDTIDALLARWIPAGASVLELGCGSGRDARRMAALGARVTATDGSGSLLELARAHPDVDPSTLVFRSLVLPPAREAADALLADATDAFHVVYTCGCLQHLTAHELYDTAAFIDRAVDDNGMAIVIVPLDHPGEPDRPSFTRDRLDYITLFERMGFRLAYETSADNSGTAGFACRWCSFVFLREAGSHRANTRFRRILEKDRKTATYKLALLRSLCNINRTMPRLVRFEGEFAHVPLGLIAERWVRDYWQLHKLPRLPNQIVRNRTPGFLASLDAAMADCAGSHAIFETLTADPNRSAHQTELITRLFDDVVTTLTKGPVQYITDNDAPLFHVRRPRGQRPPYVDRRSLLTRYGELAFPAELWLELNRIAPWLEDSLTLEWARLSARFDALAHPEAPIPMADILVKLLPPDSARDTTFASDLYKEILQTDGLCCVWSGRELTLRTLAVDHMLPWARFHTNDLWNLMPANVDVNLKKSDAIPSCDKLYASRNAIIGNWQRLNRAAPVSFASEAEVALTRTPLPATHWETPLFDALLETADMAMRQLQAPSWS